jgi:hypothetical protein
MQFDRVARIEIGPPGQDGIAVTGLRVAFEIEKSIKPTANTAKFSVYNLAEGTRSRVQEQYQRVALFAGYRGEDVFPLVFSGDVDDVVHRRVAPEWASEIRCGDGRKALREQRCSLGFGPGANIGQVCKAVAKSMALPIADESDLDGIDLEFDQGFSFNGQAEEAMRRAAAAAGLEWSIQGGVLYFLPRNGTRNVQAIVLSPDSGLIDTPERLVRAKESVKATAPKSQWVARCLLNGRIEPGMPVEIRSQTVRGVFRVDALRHVGDTHGDDWFTELELGVYGSA